MNFKTNYLHIGFTIVDAITTLVQNESRWNCRSGWVPSEPI